MRQTIRRASRGLLPVLVVSCTLAADAGATRGSGRHVEHALTVSLDPPSHRLVVSDSIRFPERPADGAVEFVLNGALRLRHSDPPAREVPLGDGRAFFGINSGGGADPERGVGLKRYRLVLPPGRSTLALSYDGVIAFGLSDAREQYTRGFRETAGIVGPEGVYLAGSGFWYPSFDRGLVEFTIDVRQPDGWHVISQGNGTSRDGAGRAHWESGGPMDEIYLVGGPLQVFRGKVGAVETLVYLHDRDEAIASKYLAATAQYIDMYRRLIGPYPYGKFALVENFWETGYGMPTFTLLGREIIRFPFIISSSYPHEILHNWWGNSVFVDYERGNWCEGLTAYLADHLIQEQRGAGAEYRRATLQKYRDYVKEGRDFPLTAFRSRHSAATEAVGYGKALMGFHALRLTLGDELFGRALARLYRDLKGKRAAFADLQATVEAVSGRDMGRFFSDWTERTGAPALAVEKVVVGGQVPGLAEGEHSLRGPRRHHVQGVLRQIQGGPPFALDVPIVVQTATGVVRRTVRLEGAEQAFTIDTPDLPLALHVDPYFDVFRKLDPRETPPSIGQIFGESRALAILPSSARSPELQAWRALFAAWTSDSHAIETRLDTEVNELPRDRAVWIAGGTNRWADRVFPGRGGVVGGGREIDGQPLPPQANTIVLTARHPENAERAVGWLSVDPLAAFPGLARKLPHYGKYSYLAFEGDEPVNVVKGQWRESDSPLRVLLSRASAAVAALPPDRRKPLVELPPVFSEEALAAHVSFLAAPEREGRVPGSAGHEAAAAYIAGRFKALGLAPGGDEGGYLQRFTMTGPGGTPLQAANVIGTIRGTRADWAKQAVLVTAHYDHLGAGWPDVHQGDGGKVHPGADDNASGVAVLLELARVIASGEKPPRTIVFVAFSGEEAGRIGSAFYAAHPGGFALADTMGVVNIDTVGRLTASGVSVLGAETATEWPHIFRGASYVTGVESRSVTGATDSSDQASFIERGVPAVQIFTGAHEDYHRPTDTADKVDAAGLVKVATLVREGVSYLAERPEPLTVTITAREAGAAPGAAATREGGGAGAPRPPGATRRVSFGTVPDFGFAGPGVRVSSVVAASPAEKAGVRAGDVLTSVDGRPVADLRGYSDILRTLSPGQTVSAVVLRDGREVVLKVTLAER